MPIIISALIGAIAVALLLVLIFALLFIQNREAYLRDWLIAWTFSLIALCCMLGAGVNPAVLTPYMIFFSMFIYFLLRASYQFFKIKMPQYWKYAAFVIIIWSIASPLLSVSESFKVVPWSIFAGIALIFYGVMFVRYGDKRISGRMIAGVFYILWGIHALDFYFLKMNPSLAQWGFPIGTIVATGGAFGTLFYYFDMKNKELLRIEEELKYSSLHDSLTGLFNRNCFELEIKRREEEMRTGENNCPPTGIMICDVDGLKLVNDTLGHERGDALLIEAARVIRSVFPESCLAARIGGDEFAVLADENEEGLARAYQNIRQALQQYNAGNPGLPLSISVGYAVDSGFPDLTRVFKEADNNMYREKRKQSQDARDSIIESLKSCSTPDRIQAIPHLGLDTEIE